MGSNTEKMPESRIHPAQAFQLHRFAVMSRKMLTAALSVIMGDDNIKITDICGQLPVIFECAFSFQAAVFDDQRILTSLIEFCDQVRKLGFVFHIDLGSPASTAGMAGSLRWGTGFGILFDRIA